MNRYTLRLGALFLLSSLLWACGPDSDPGDPPGAGGCGPFGCREPEPGWAKFTVGNADAVRWTGFKACHEIDLRTGKQPGNGLTQVTGQISRSAYCPDDRDQGAFSFISIQLTDTLAGSWATAYLPQDASAANQLLDNCTWDTRPPPSALIGQWWHANKTYAENQILGYLSPLSFASTTIPFDDDGFERLGEETVRGTPTIIFQNEQATVWMINDGEARNTPLRTLANSYDLTFSEWDVPFEAAIPPDIRELSEVCDTI